MPLFLYQNLDFVLSNNVESFVCSRCGNKNPKYIGHKNGQPYCRFCISMRGESAKPYTPKGGLTVLDLKYKLSKEQDEIANQVLENYKNGIDTLINAVCGAGKTELVYKVIAYALSVRKTVGFSIPRRDVVIELFPRLKSAFPSNSVTMVYGGNTNRLTADIVLLTTHQLYRYENFFDLLIVDEIDAFPYKGNILLNKMFKRSLRGHFVLMSATPSESVLNYFRKPGRSLLELNTRFHHKPLPVPTVKIRPGISKIPYLIKKLKEFVSEKKPTFVFVPTIEACEDIFKIISKFVPNGQVVHSKHPNREKIIADFKNGIYMYLVTTAVLERGVTIKNLQVIIYEADHKLYDEYSLIQISGRVGRKFDAPEGEVIFIATKETSAIINAIKTIRKRNTYL